MEDWIKQMGFSLTAHLTNERQRERKREGGMEREMETVLLPESTDILVVNVCVWGCVSVCVYVQECVYVCVS